SDKSTEGINVSPEETVLTGMGNSTSQFISLKDEGKLALSSTKDTVDVHYSETQDDFFIPMQFALSGMPVAVVDDGVFQQLGNNLEEDIQGPFGSTYVGIDIPDENELQQ